MYKASAPIQPGEAPPKVVTQDIHELRTAENSCGYLLPRLAALRVSNPGRALTLLDIGCGVGSITATLVPHLGPGGRVTGADFRREPLARAREIAEAQGVAASIDFREADATALPFADGEFDVVHAHQTLAHIRDPVVVLREMLRVVKPGGIVAVREAVFESESWWPDNEPQLHKFHDMISTMLKAAGDPNVGKKLLVLAKEAGAAAGSATLTYGASSFTGKEAAVCSETLAKLSEAGRIRDALVAQKMATEAELDDMAKGWRKWAKNEDCIVGMLQGQLLIEK